MSIIWFTKNILNKVIRNKQNLIHEDICWKFQRNKVSRENEGLGEKLSFEIEGEGWDLILGEETKFVDSRAKLETFLHLWWETCKRNT